MPMTKAEIQKSYRERKKAREGEEYFKKERQRVKKCYIPTSKLSPGEKKKRNEKKKMGMRRHRAKKAAASDPTEQNSDEGPLIVDFKFQNRTKGAKVRRSNIIARQRRDLTKAKSEAERWSKRYKALQRKYSRAEDKRQGAKGVQEPSNEDSVLPHQSKDKVQSTSKNQSNKSKGGASAKPECLPSTSQQNKGKTPPSTPRGKALSDLRKSGINPKSAPTVLRNLISFYAMTKEVKVKADQKKTKSKQDIERLITGKVVKKYRCMKNIAVCTGVNRNHLSNLEEKLLTDGQKHRLTEERGRLQKRITEFLQRDDNSRVMPDKDQVVKVDGENVPKRVLNDYLHNLYEKFSLENTDVKISLTTFQRMRPKHLLLVAFATKRSCLCIKHQNFVLKLKSFAPSKRADDADHFVKDYTDEEILAMIDEIECQKIKYKTWKSVLTGPEDDKKKKMMVVDIEVTKEEFRDMIERDLRDFRQHLDLISNQYKEIKRLKENLPRNHAAVQMDFAENYQCSSASAVQSEYWNKVFITLHPCVIYFKDEDGTSLKHKSVVFVTDELSHNAGTVFSFMKRLAPILKELVPGLLYTHYLSDSPTSQYRNKHMFYIVSNHNDLLGTEATWSYFEAGHGKGPCDGVGAVAKKMADDTVKKESAEIQDAKSFVLASQEQKAIQYELIEKEEVKRSQEELQKINVKPVKRTMQLHAAVSVPNEAGNLMIRRASCFQSECLQERGTTTLMLPSCNGWEKVTLNITTVTADDTKENTKESENKEQETTSENVAEDVAFDVGDWVASVYKDDWYIGVVLDVDNESQDVNINFMQKYGEKQITFKWPPQHQKDILYVPFKDVICRITEPKASGKRARFYILPQKEIGSIAECFRKYNMKT